MAMRQMSLRKAINYWQTGKSPSLLQLLIILFYDAFRYIASIEGGAHSTFF